MRRKLKKFLMRKFVREFHDAWDQESLIHEKELEEKGLEKDRDEKDSSFELMRRVYKRMELSYPGLSTTLSLYDFDSLLYKAEKPFRCDSQPEEK